jgi:hypothetical protein
VPVHPNPMNIMSCLRAHVSEGVIYSKYCICVQATMKSVTVQVILLVQRVNKVHM